MDTLDLIYSWIELAMKVIGFLVMLLCGMLYSFIAWFIIFSAILN